MKEKETSVIITREIRNAIIEVINYEFDKKNIRFAEEIGISPSTVGKWITPDKTAQIKTSLYNLIFPKIKKYLDNPRHDNINIPKTHDDCQKLCEHLDKFEKSTFKKYSELGIDVRKEIWKKLDTMVGDAEKKSAGGNCPSPIDMDHDKHQAG